MSLFLTFLGIVALVLGVAFLAFWWGINRVLDYQGEHAR